MMPKSGGEPTVVVTLDAIAGAEGCWPWDLAVYGSKIYLAASHGPDTVIAEVPLDGDSPRVLTTHPGWPTSLCVDEGSVYWLNSNYPEDCTVMKAPRTGGSAVQIGSAGAWVSDESQTLAIDATSAYWSYADDRWSGGHGSIRKVALEGGEPVAIAEGMGIRSVVVDETSVYWTVEDGIMKASK